MKNVNDTVTYCNVFLAKLPDIFLDFVLSIFAHLYVKNLQEIRKLKFCVLTSTSRLGGFGIYRSTEKLVLLPYVDSKYIILAYCNLPEGFFIPNYIYTNECLLTIIITILGVTCVSSGCTPVFFTSATSWLNTTLLLLLGGRLFGHSTTSFLNHANNPIFYLLALCLRQACQPPH